MQAVKIGKGKRLVMPTEEEIKRDRPFRPKPSKQSTISKTSKLTAITFSRKLDDNICFQLFFEFKFNDLPKIKDFSDFIKIFEQHKKEFLDTKSSKYSALFQKQQQNAQKAQRYIQQQKDFKNLDLNVEFEHGQTHLKVAQTNLGTTIGQRNIPSGASIMQKNESKLSSSKLSSDREIEIASGVIWKPKEEKEKDPVYIPANHDIWNTLNVRLEQYINCLEQYSYIDNMPYMKHVIDLYKITKEQIPQGSAPTLVRLNILRYMTLMNALANQYQDAIQYTKEYKQVLFQKISFDQLKKYDKEKTILRFNMRMFAIILFLKARIRIVEYDFEGAYKALFKINRMLQNNVLTELDQEAYTLQYYNLMTQHNTNRRDLTGAYAYIKRELQLHKEISDRKTEEIEAKKKKAEEEQKAAKEFAKTATDKKNFQKIVQKKNVITPQMLVQTKNGRKLKLEFNPLSFNPIGPRLDHLRQLILFSDYMAAERVLLPLIKDVCDCIRSNFFIFQPKQCIDFISLAIYLFFKLSRFQDIIDFTESFLQNPQIMERCNPFSLFYIMEVYRKDKRLSEIFQYQSIWLNKLREKFFAARLKIKKKWLANPNFLFFGHMDSSLAEDQDWQEIAYYFIEAITDHFIFLRAIRVEFKQNFKKFYQNRNALIKSSFELRVQLFLLKDQEENSTLQDLWPR